MLLARTTLVISDYERPSSQPPLGHYFLHPKEDLDGTVKLLQLVDLEHTHIGGERQHIRFIHGWIEFSLLFQLLLRRGVQLQFAEEAPEPAGAHSGDWRFGLRIIAYG